MSHADQPWSIPPTDLRLRENEVHVWRVLLEITIGEVASLQDILVDDEIARARKFYFEKDRRHWIVAHAVLRLLIGRYVNSDPRSLRFFAMLNDRL